ncbi:MAG: divalent-cation tolerance protein CutA [Candidatus Delongbacteria bacterium]
MSDLRLVMSTVGSARQAKELGRQLVEEGLAACVTLLPGCVSVYRWEGEMQEEPECLLLIKTLDERLDDLELRLGQLHPYELPEFLALEPAAVSDGYLGWVQAACGKSS